jgi:hypothetical protein
MNYRAVPRFDTSPAGLGDLEQTQPLTELPPSSRKALPPEARIRVEALFQISERRRQPHGDAAEVRRLDEALAEWIAGVYLEGRRAGVLEAAGDVDALEQSQAAIVELAAAHATFAEVAQQATRIAQVQAIVRRGMTISQSYDLSNTLLEELDALRGRLAGILQKYPELVQLASPDVEARSAELQRPDGSPIV